MEPDTRSLILQEAEFSHPHPRLLGLQLCRSGGARRDHESQRALPLPDQGAADRRPGSGICSARHGDARADRAAACARRRPAQSLCAPVSRRFRERHVAAFAARCRPSAPPCRRARAPSSSIFFQLQLDWLARMLEAGQAAGALRAGLGAGSGGLAVAQHPRRRLLRRLGVAAESHGSRGVRGDAAQPRDVESGATERRPSLMTM